MEFILYFFIFYLWHSLGIALGYHRVLAHQAVTLPRPWLYFLLLGGYLSLQGAPVSWVGIHRLHHQVTDTPSDPHTPLRGYFYAFIGWLFAKNPNTDHLTQDITDPVIRFFGTGPVPARPWLNLLCFIGFRLLLLVMLGPVVAGASLLAGLLVFCLPNLVNTLCHSKWLGYTNYTLPNHSRNIGGLFCILTVGESLHNNHHKHPRSITNSTKPGEIDIVGFLYETFKKYP